MLTQRIGKGSAEILGRGEIINTRIIEEYMKTA